MPGTNDFVPSAVLSSTVGYFLMCLRFPKNKLISEMAHAHFDANTETICEVFYSIKKRHILFVARLAIYIAAFLVVKEEFNFF